ncbi:TPA_asm: PolA-S3H [Monosiga MELD virus 2]|nr:TPA_asm: PolA-S3H [Monosiga MELD virus 2]
MNPNQTNQTNQTIIKKTELIDIKTLKWLISNYNSLDIDRYCSQSLDEYQYNNSSQKDLLIKIMKKTTMNGQLKATFKQSGSKNRGRFYAQSSLSLQCLMRELRGAIAKKNYYDVDIVNCEPTILLQFCQKNFNELNTPQLESYVKNRDSLLSSLMTQYSIDKDSAKGIILQLSKGGTKQYNALSNKPSWLVELKAEYESIGTEVLSMFPEDKKYCQMKKPKPHCIWGSVLAIQMQIVENDIVQTLDSYLTSEGYHVDTLIFDGVLVRNDKKLEQSDLIEASKEVANKTGYNVQFIVKQFDESIQIPDNLLTNDEEYQVLKKEFEKNICKITTPVQFLNLKKFNAVSTFDDTQDHEIDYMTKKSLMESYEDYSTWKGTTITGGRTPKSFIENWIKDPCKECFERMDFLPNPLKCPDETFNTFRGLDIEKVTNGSYDEKYVTAINNHLSYLVDGDSKSIKYVQNFFAQLIQQPGILSRVALLFKSRQGSGKNLFLDIIRAMIGHKYYITTANPKDRLYSRFNSAKAFKLLINIDETQGKETDSFYESLKADITNPTVEVEKKGQDSFRVMNFARYVFTTNNENALRLDKSDRRFAMFECTSKRKDKSYYQYLASLKENKDALFSYYTFLKGIDISNFDFINERPMTKIYMRSMRQSEQNIYEYLQNLVINEIEDDSDMIILKGDTYQYNAPQLYKDYVQFCINNKYVDRLNRKTFDSTLELIMSKSRNKKGYCWKFDKKYLENYLKQNEYWVEMDKCLIDDDDDDDNDVNQSNEYDVDSEKEIDEFAMTFD